MSTSGCVFQDSEAPKQSMHRFQDSKIPRFQDSKIPRFQDSRYLCLLQRFVRCVSDTAHRQLLAASLTHVNVRLCVPRFRSAKAVNAPIPRFQDSKIPRFQDSKIPSALWALLACPVCGLFAQDRQEYFFYLISLPPSVFILRFHLPVWPLRHPRRSAGHSAGCRVGNSAGHTNPASRVPGIESCKSKSRESNPASQRIWSDAIQKISIEVVPSISSTI